MINLREFNVFLSAVLPAKNIRSVYLNCTSLNSADADSANIIVIFKKLGKELMTQDELAVMDGGKCIFMLRGVRPFLSDKYDLTRHPNYRYTADADPKNVFDMERYMKKQRAVVKPTDTFDVYEIDATT